ncbi:MAG: alpha/beta hydrolase [Ruminococcus sp.]|nr:alpha/beta hydrolase [Ruminococcus sp.]
MPYQNLQETKIFYEEYGAGEPLIFIHGSLSTGNETFQKQIHYFESSFRCICPDLRCHGKSSGNSSQWDTKLLSEDIAEFMNKKSIISAHLIGHSMGGDVAMYCALNHPNRVSSVALISDGAAVNDRVTAYLERLRPDRIDHQRYAKLIDKLQNRYEEEWEDFIKRTIWNCSVYPVFSDEDLMRIAVPVLLIRGGQDEMVLDSEVDRLKQYLPDFQYHMIPNGNHFLHSQAENYCKVNQIIKAFLSTIHYIQNAKRNNN